MEQKDHSTKSAGFSADSKTDSIHKIGIFSNVGLVQPRFTWVYRADDIRLWWKQCFFSSEL